jgi:hypothetical protein
MSSPMSGPQSHAKSKIENTWQTIAQQYNAGWIGPIETVETTFPHVSSKLGDITPAISPTLPMIIYQTRNSPPANMTVAVPYESGGDRYKCRLVATNKLTDPEMRLFAEFAQALWLLIDSAILPAPQAGKDFEKKLVEWTGPSLIAR